MSWKIDTTTLPKPPKKVAKKHPAWIKEIGLPGGGPLLLSFGTKAVVMTWEGTIAKKGLTAAQLETNYINPLKAKVYHEVTVSAPDTRYDGTFLLFSFIYKETGGIVNSFDYKLEFIKGAQHVVM